jgi:hypothetical protein
MFPQMTANNSFFIMFAGDSGGGFIVPLNFKDALHNQKKNRLVYNAVGGTWRPASLTRYLPRTSPFPWGARYQYLYFIGSDSSGYLFKGKSDHYYGGTFSTIFSFDLKRRAKPEETNGSDT